MQKLLVMKNHRRKEGFRTFCLTIFEYVFLIILLFPFSAWAQDDVQMLNRDLSLRYTQLAAETDSGPGASENISLVHTALVFWPSNPDALFMQARLYSYEGQYDRVLEILPRVFSGVPLQLFEKSEVLRFYISSLIRFDHTSEALMLMSLLPVEMLRGRELLEQRSRALEIEGLFDNLRETLREGVRLYPESDILQSMFVQYSSDYRRSVRQRILSGTEKGVYGQRTMQRVIENTSLKIQKEKLLELYKNEWGSDQFEKVFELEIAENMKEDDIAHALTAADPVPEQLLDKIRKIARDRGAEDLFFGAWSEFSGSIRRDPDGDGFYEVDEIYINGEIRTVYAQTDGDPESEISVVFNDGRPFRFSMENTDGNMVEGTYRVYPELKSIRLPGGRNAVLEVELVPYSIRFPFAGWNLYKAPERVPLPSSGDFPDFYKLLTNAAYVNAIEKENLSARYVRDLSRVEEIQDSSIRMKGDFIEGKIEERKRDPDGDGFFEIREYYQAGELFRISYDGNKNSIPEYIEEHGVVIEKKWDVDEDGIVEYRIQESRN